MTLSSFVHFLRDQPSWLLFFASLGILSLTKFTISFFTYFYVFFLRPSKDLAGTYGSWAVITGPTDGIGKFIAFELARKGLNLILLGRSPNKLQQVSTAIKNEVPSVEIKTVVADLSDDIKLGAERLYNSIKGLDIGLLVNNAGLAEPCALFFHEVDIEAWMKIVKVNVEALTVITRTVLPLLVNKGRGAIVNMGSGSTVVIPSYPLFSVYAGTKEYVNQFSRYLCFEYKGRGIDIQCQAPLYVTTNMTSNLLTMKWHSFLLEPQANIYARAAVRWIGYESLCIPYLPHFIQWCLAALVPNFIHYKMRFGTNLEQRNIIITKLEKER